VIFRRARVAVLLIALTAIFFCLVGPREQDAQAEQAKTNTTQPESTTAQQRAAVALTLPGNRYEAIVVEQNGDMFTLRWRDYPRERRIVRHRLRLGLLYPGPRPTAENGKSAKASGHAKHDKPGAANPAANSQSLPKDWDEIASPPGPQTGIDAEHPGLPAIPKNPHNFL
jgi:hypothetical protein